MRIHIRHITTYTYDAPALAVTQLLRLTPRNFEGQTVRRWRIELDCDGLLKAREDAFGNIMHLLSLNGPVRALTVVADGEVDTNDTDGMVRGAIEYFPPALYLRETPLTSPSDDIRAYAREATGGTAGLEALHRLLAAIHRDIAFDTAPTEVGTTAMEAFVLKSGVCQDLTHIFIACARTLGIPARYVGGYLWRADGGANQNQDAGHAWAEAFVAGLGWVGFDPANGISSTAAHVRVAAGLDYLGAAPVRGSRTGGPGERLGVIVAVERDIAGGQNQ